MLGFRDRLDRRPRRVLVTGVTGSGKSTLARQIARDLRFDYVEIDSLYHGPNWEPRETFEADVAEFTTRDEWVIEWQYRTVRPLLADRADTVVWLDHPTGVSLMRVVRRTIRRSRDHEVLWNGNVEPPLRTVFTDREHILRWAVQTRRTYRAMVPELERSHPELQIVRLRNQREVDGWLRGPLNAAR